MHTTMITKELYNLKVYYIIDTKITLDPTSVNSSV